MNTFKSLLLTLILLAGASEAFADDGFKVGLTLPLTGIVAGMGQAFQRGVDLYLEQHPQEAASIKLVTEDHKYDGVAAASTCNKLISIDKSQLTIVWGNTPSSICAPIAERLKSALLTISMNPDAKGRTHVMSLGPRNDGLAKRMVDYFNSLHSEHPAAVTIDIGTAVQAVDEVKAGLRGNLAVKLIPNGDSDFRSIIAALKAQQIDAVLLFLLPDQALTFAQQAVELDFRVPVVGGDVFADEAFQHKFKKLFPSLAFVYGAVKPEFISQVRAKYGDASYVFETACGYAAVQLLVRVQKYLRDTGTADPIEALKKIDLSGTPVIDLALKTDPEYATHIETGFATYTAE